jgi:hypothetical protein
MVTIKLTVYSVGPQTLSADNNPAVGPGVLVGGAGGSSSLGLEPPKEPWPLLLATLAEPGPSGFPTESWHGEGQPVWLLQL